jgi:hypothetical protein
MVQVVRVSIRANDFGKDGGEKIQASKTGTDYEPLLLKSKWRKRWRRTLNLGFCPNPQPSPSI